jgi:hypothetical protein
MKISELNVIKHTYEYLNYNNCNEHKISKDIMCITICYMTTNDSVKNVELKVFQAHYGYLNASECITSFLYFWRLRFKTSKYDGTVCNVVQKSFLYEWKKEVKPQFEKRYTAGRYTINFLILEFSFETLI